MMEKLWSKLVEHVLENKNKDKDFHIKSVLADGHTIVTRILNIFKRKD